MKKYLLAAILIAALVSPTLVGAQGETLPGTGWWTGQQIQNIGTAPATIVSHAYDAHGPADYTATSPSAVAPGASVTFLPDAFGMPNGFEGSAVVSSDQPIKAIVSLTNRQVGAYGVAGGVAGGQYQGIDGSAADDTVSFPIVKNAFGSGANIKTTTFFVQNAGQVATTVHAEFKCGNGNSYPWDSPAAINPGQMVVIDPAAAGVPAGQACAGTVTSTATTPQPLAGVAAEHYATETVATLVQSTRGFTPADYANVIYAPAFKNKAPDHPTQGRSAGAQIQNVGSAAITVHAEFKGSGTCAGPYTADSTSIQPGASFTFFKANSNVPIGCVVAGTFTASAGGQIVGIVNESYLDPAPAAGTQSATAYNMMSGGGATTKVAAPLFKEMFGSKTSGLQVQNIGSADTEVWVEFKSGASGLWTTKHMTVAAGASFTFYRVSMQDVWPTGGTPMPAGTAAGATVFSSSQNVLAIVSEQTYYVSPLIPNCYGQADATHPCYDRQNYEGFDVAP